MSKTLEKNHWTRGAVCKFDSKLLSFHPDDVKEVKSMCALCPVRKECINWIAEIDGNAIAAGMSKYDRLLKQWKRIGGVDESNFGGSDRYISKVL